MCHRQPQPWETQQRVYLLNKKHMFYSWKIFSFLYDERTVGNDCRLPSSPPLPSSLSTFSIGLWWYHFIFYILCYAMRVICHCTHIFHHFLSSVVVVVVSWQFIFMHGRSIAQFCFSILAAGYVVRCGRTAHFGKTMTIETIKYVLVVFVCTSSYTLYTNYNFK